MLEKCGEQVNVTIWFNVDNVYKMEIIISASQSVLAVFFDKNTLCKAWKNMASIYIQVSVGKYRSQWFR